MADSFQKFLDDYPLIRKLSDQVALFINSDDYIRAINAGKFDLEELKTAQALLVRPDVQVRLDLLDAQLARDKRKGAREVVKVFWLIQNTEKLRLLEPLIHNLPDTSKSLEPISWRVLPKSLRHFGPRMEMLFPNVGDSIGEQLVYDVMENWSEAMFAECETLAEEMSDEDGEALDKWAWEHSESHPRHFAVIWCYFKAVDNLG